MLGNNLKIGDKVYHLRHGECEIIRKYASEPYYTIRPVGKTTGSYTVRSDGKSSTTDHNAVAFLAKPVISFPTYKYKVLFADIAGKVCLTSGYYKDQEDFEKNGLSNTTFIQLLTDLKQEVS